MAKITIEDGETVRVIEGDIMSLSVDPDIFMRHSKVGSHSVRPGTGELTLRIRYTNGPVDVPFGEEKKNG